MTELSTFSPFVDPQAQAAAAAAATQAACEECAGTGGWYRYEPSHPEPGLLYLSCLGCRGSGRLAFPKD
jgi:hypothetical protein